MKTKLTTNIFINRSNIVHNKKYDYSTSNYINSHTKILIICNIHGKFYQLPYHHLRGIGCPKCGKSKKLTIEEFILISNKKHNNKYNYSKSIYVNNHTKLIISCPKHGDFLQKPNDHMNGHGCDICGGKIKITSKEFIIKANLIHNNKFDYSNIEYTNTTTKTNIKCVKHGEFYQLPSSHLQGVGCPKCNYEKLALIKVSKAESDFLDYIKIDINNRSKFIENYIVDGYDPFTNTIYEFLGDYWHGNPKKFKPNKINKSVNKTYKELYDYTFHRFKNIKTIGYNINYIWESDWNTFKDGLTKKPNIFKF